jgi:hypothetical protein
VTIIEHQEELGRTLYSANFFTNKAVACALIERICVGDIDIEDAIFELRRIEDKNKNG